MINNAKVLIIVFISDSESEYTNASYKSLMNEDK